MSRPKTKRHRRLQRVLRATVAEAPSPYALDRVLERAIVELLVRTEIRAAKKERDHWRRVGLCRG